MIKNDFTGVLIAGLAAYADAAPQNPPERPNILYIICDDIGVGALSCYGSRLISTPAIDRIAREGVRFENAFVTMSLCSPSRATILTGTYPHRNGMVAISMPFDGSQPTFPKYLQSAGYRTAIFGKWHLHTEPTGFDEYAIHIGQGNYFDPYFIETGLVLKQSSGYETDLVADKTLSFIRNQTAADQPFFVQCSFKAPHHPYLPNEKFRAQMLGREWPVPSNFNEDISRRMAPETLFMKIEDMHMRDGLSSDWKKLPRDLPTLEQRRINFQQYMRDYLACVAAVDENIGRILEFLDQNGQARNTVVFFTSDNGFFLGEHGLEDKKLMYEESIRVPFIMRAPGRIPPETVVRELIANHDQAPTILDYAGIPCPEQMQGRSFRPLAEGRPVSGWPESLYFQWFGEQRNAVWGQIAVRTKDFKLIHYNQNMNEWEMFDLRYDPQEMNDISGDLSYAPQRAQLQKLIEEHRTRLGITEAVEKECRRYGSREQVLDEFFAWRDGFYRQVRENTRRAGSVADLSDVRDEYASVYAEYLKRKGAK
jgi:arylsulfatase A-like enzyme